MVHRPPALSPARPRALGGGTALIALAALESLWLAWFILEPLPGVSGRGHLCRGDLLLRALPAVVPDVGFGDSHLGIALANLRHVENLRDRAPIVLAAGYLATSAIATGSLVLRLLRLRAGLGRRERVALGFGLGSTMLGLGALVAGRLGWLTPWSARSGLGLPIVVEGVLALLRRRSDVVPGPAMRLRPALGFALVTGPFLLLMILGAMQPTIEFDSLEYHLQGPKEYYQGGRVAFLPHNVYASMPFGVEMLHLIGMEVVDDWWLGALVGQLVVALFAPASAAMIVLSARRLGSPRAGWVAGVVYLTTPWVFRLGATPLVEGPLCFFHAALVWAWARGAGPGARPSVGLASCVGLLAGGAMAIKYPALISAVIPATLWAAATARRARSWRVAFGFLAGLAVVAGPWLVKNVADTGNPVYPLGYHLFGGRHWTADRDAKWLSAHGPKAVEWAAFARSVGDVAGRSDWQSPLYAGLAPLALLGASTRRPAARLWGYSAYLFLTWWLLTHRLDRFWLPILPPMAVLAGLGFDAVRSRAGTTILGAMMAAGIGSNLVLCSTELAGPTGWTEPLEDLRRTVPRSLLSPLPGIDERLPPGARLLLVGQAGVFHMDHPVSYNTVFDDDLFEGLARGRTPEEVRDALARRGITHVYVDWSEIKRYQSPGNYGFTPFVTPEAFARLVVAGVLGPAKRPDYSINELYEVRPGPGPGR